MKTQWTAEQNGIRSKFAALGDGVTANFRAADDPAQFDRISWERVTAAGLWKLPIASTYGGADGTWWEFSAALEGLATTSQDLGFLLSIIAQAGALRVISSHGSEEQKRELLPRLLEGQVASTATTESHGGSDVARVRTAARNAGNRLLLSGQKAHITNAPIAEIFVILGRIPALGAKKDITLFVLERAKARGLETAEAEITLGNRTSPTGDILLKDVVIEPENILGPGGGGLAVLYSMLSLDRLLYALVAGGFAEHMLGMAMEFAGSRRTFGRPLADHQLVQDKIVGIRTNMEIARCLAYTALERMLKGQDDASLICSIAKLVGTEGLWKSSQELLQLHGHAGYMEGPVSQVLKDVVATRIAGGTSEMQKLNIFKQLSRQYGREAVA